MTDLEVGFSVNLSGEVGHRLWIASTDQPMPAEESQE
jgi:hypothetical protein